MAFKLHARVIWLSNDPEIKPMRERIFSGVVTKLGRDIVYVDNKHKPEDCLYAAFVWPDLPGPRALLEKTVDMKERHEREEKELMIETMQMNNLCVREGVK